MSEVLGLSWLSGIFSAGSSGRDSGGVLLGGVEQVAGAVITAPPAAAWPVRGGRAVPDHQIPPACVRVRYRRCLPLDGMHAQDLRGAPSD